MLEACSALLFYLQFSACVMSSFSYKSKNLKLLESGATSFSDDDLTFVSSLSWEHYITDFLYKPQGALLKYGMQKFIKYADYIF